LRVGAAQPAKSVSAANVNARMQCVRRN